jgi:nucleoid-associated protein YgaU
MGNFEKLSVLVIGVIIVMILVVALYTWTDDPAAEEHAAVGGGRGLIAQNPRVSGPGVSGPGVPAAQPEDPWDYGVEPAPPKAVEVVTDRPDEPGVKVEEKVDDVAVKPAVDEPLGQPAERTYAVKEGDTLGGIALSEMGSTKYWKVLQERNDVDPMKLRPGMTLIIPAIAGTAIAPNKSPASVAAGGPAKPGAAYTVRKGDTIQKISQSAYRTIERWTDIWFANMERISDPRELRPGMTLDIPN